MTARAENSLKKLQRLAQAEIEQARADLAEIEAAQRANATAIEALDGEDEEEAAASDPALVPIYVQFRACSQLRREALNNARAALIKSEDVARARLESAVVEFRKFDALLSARGLERKRRRARAETTAADEWARGSGKPG